MRHFQTFIIASFIFSSVSAQENPLIKKNDNLKKILELNKLKILKVPANPPNIDEVYTFNNKKAKFLYETESGKVNALPLDNMPCLVPNINSNMPGLKSKPENDIPNPFHK